MAIPSGSGSERLRRVTANDNTGWNEILSGIAGHLYTIISVIYCNRNSGTSIFSFRMNDGSNDIALVESTTIAGYGTFVFNDKFVLEEDDDIDIYNSNTGDWLISYIDQDWT